MHNYGKRRCHRGRVHGNYYRVIVYKRWLVVLNT